MNAGLSIMMGFHLFSRYFFLKITLFTTKKQAKFLNVPAFTTTPFDTVGLNEPDRFNSLWMSSTAFRSLKRSARMLNRLCVINYSSTPPMRNMPVQIANPSRTTIIPIINPLVANKLNSSACRFFIDEEGITVRSFTSISAFCE